MPGLGAYALAGGMTGTGNGLVEFQRQKQREAEMLLRRQWQLEDRAAAEAAKAKGGRSGGGGLGGSTKSMPSSIRKEVDAKITEMMQTELLTRDEAMTRLSNDPLYADVFQKYLPSIYEGRSEPSVVLDAPEAPEEIDDPSNARSPVGGGLSPASTARRLIGGLANGSKDTEVDVTKMNDPVTGETLAPEMPATPSGELSPTRGLAPSAPAAPSAPEATLPEKPNPKLPNGLTKQAILREARKALDENRSRVHIENMLIEWGIDPKEL